MVRPTHKDSSPASSHRLKVSLTVRKTPTGRLHSTV